MLVFALSTLVAFASCEGENTMLLSNVVLPANVSPVRLFREYGKNSESFIIVKIVKELPTLGRHYETYKNQTTNYNINCAVLANAYQELKKAYEVKSFNPASDDNDNAEARGVWYIDGEVENESMFEVFKTITTPEDQSKITTSIHGATTQPSTSGSTAPAAPAKQAEQASGEPVSHEHKNVMMIMTTCDLNAQVNEEEILQHYGPGHDKEICDGMSCSKANPSSGFTAAMAPLFLVPLVFFA